MKKVLFILTALIVVLSSCEKYEDEFGNELELDGAIKIPDPAEVFVGNWELIKVCHASTVQWCNPDGVVQCHGNTLEGVRCKNRTSNKNGYCYLHGSQDDGTYNKVTLGEDITTTREATISYLKSRKWDEHYGINWGYDFKVFKENGKYVAQYKPCTDNTWTNDKTFKAVIFNDGMDGDIQFFDDKNGNGEWDWESGQDDTNEFATLLFLVEGGSELDYNKKYAYKPKSSDGTTYDFYNNTYGYKELRVYSVYCYYPYGLELVYKKIK